MPQRPELGSILVAEKVATGSEIEAARRAGGPLWRALLDAEVVTEEELFNALRACSGMPVAADALLQHTVPAEKLALFLSKDDALRSGILPLELSANGRRVQIAMIDPTDEKSLRSLAQSAGFQSAKVFLVSRSAFVAAVERAYPAQRSTVEPAGRVGTRSEAEADERLEQVLVQATLSLGAALERELSRDGSGPSPREAARLAREVARELGHDRRRVALAGVAAQLVQLEELRRARAEDEESLFDELGWAASGDDGLLGIARALTATAAGFARPQTAGATQRVVQAVIDYLGLATMEESTSLEATAQLLRTSSAGAPVIDALLCVLRRDLSERTPAVATILPDAPSEVTNVRRAPVRSPSDERTQLVSISDLTGPQK